MKIKSRFKIIGLVAFAVAGLVSYVALADTQSDKPTIGQGSNGTCGGTYYASARMTNSSGGFWITPPTNATSGVFQDATGLPAPYSSVVLVSRKTNPAQWCGTNSVTFPVTNSTYSLYVFVTSTPPPTNMLILQVSWNTN
jgi:hypothetical protein